MANDLPNQCEIIKSEDMGASVTESPRRGRNTDPTSHHPLRIATFSPPSQIFDASRAIREAVNHLDLANYEPSIMVPPSSEQSKRSDCSILMPTVAFTWVLVF